MSQKTLSKALVMMAGVFFGNLLTLWFIGLLDVKGRMSQAHKWLESESYEDEEDD